MRIPSITKEFLFVPITEDGAAPDPSHTVELALFIVDTKEEPEETDWVTADWDAGRARLLLGPGGFTISDGYWEVWARVTTPFERPVRYSGRVRIT